MMNEKPEWIVELVRKLILRDPMNQQIVDFEKEWVELSTGDALEVIFEYAKSNRAVIREWIDSIPSREI